MSYALEQNTESGLFVVINPITTKHIAKGFNSVESALQAVWVLEGRPLNIMYGTVGFLIYPFYRRNLKC